MDTGRESDSRANYEREEAKEARVGPTGSQSGSDVGFGAMDKFRSRERSIPVVSSLVK